MCFGQLRDGLVADRIVLLVSQMTPLLRTQDVRIQNASWETMTTRYN